MFIAVLVFKAQLLVMSGQKYHNHCRRSIFLLFAISVYNLHVIYTQTSQDVVECLVGLTCLGVKQRNRSAKEKNVPVS